MVTDEYNVYRVLREADGSEAVSREKWEEVGKGKRAHIIDVLVSRFELNDEEQRELRHARGGCSCQDPGAMPPCAICTDPLSAEEAFTFALVRRAEREPAVTPEGWGDW